MSYRIEGNDVVIDGWEKGIADGPYAIASPSALGPITNTGTVNLSYGNITGVPGEVSVEYPLKLSTVVTSGGSALGIPVHKAVQIDSGNGGTVTKYFILDDKGQIFSSNLSGETVTWTYKGHVGSTNPAITGNSGLVYFQGYLFTFRAGTIYYSSDDGVTNNAFDTGLDSGTTHYAIASQFNPSTMYFCNGAFVGALIVNYGQTFDPTNSATYTFQLQAVALPSYDMSTCLAELSNQVLIGGALARVYVWDASNLSGSNTTGVVSNVLFLGDRFVYRIVVVNTNAYIFTGHPVIASGRGNIYITNGSQVDLFKKMPDWLGIALSGSYNIQNPYWTFGDAMFHRNKLFFGISSSGGTGGVWAIDLQSSVLYRSNLVTTGTNAFVTVISPLDTGTTIPGLGYWCGVNSVMNNTANTLTTSAVVTSDLIPVGTFLNKKTFEQIEIKTSAPLASGESIDIVVYQDGSLSPTTVGSMTSADGMSKVFTPLTFQANQWLQVQCTLNPTNSSPTYVRLREIRLR